MRHLTGRIATSRFQRRLARAQGIRGGIALVALALGVVGLLLVAPAVSAQARVGQAAVVAPFKGRPTRTPTPTPSPTPTATLAPSPTASPTTAATAAPSAAVTGTVNPGGNSGNSAGSGDDDAQVGTDPLGALLGWGLAALVAALLIFGTFMALFMRRAARQQPVFAPLPQRTESARMRQLYQLLPARHAEPPLKDDTTWEPPPPLKPPRWLIEAGLLRESIELPAANPPAPREIGKEAGDGPQPGDASWSG